MLEERGGEQRRRRWWAMNDGAKQRLQVLLVSWLSSAGIMLPPLLLRYYIVFPDSTFSAGDHPASLRSVRSRRHRYALDAAISP